MEILHITFINKRQYKYPKYFIQIKMTLSKTGFIG